MTEKLVEEIAWVMHECFAKTGEVPDHDYFSVLHDYAEKAITRISQAIADGELMLTKVPPKLPGEIGRWEWPTTDRPGEGYADWATRMLRTGDEMFIALRKEEMEKER